MKEFDHSFFNCEGNQLTKTALEGFNFTPLKEADAFALNPQSLAFVGDAVYTLYIRLNVTKSSTAKSGALHKKATEFVKATAQSKMLENIMPHLTEHEKDLVRRARNTNVNSPAKHATLAEYMQSTAYEALLGYLYLSGQSERLEVILRGTK